MRFSALLVLAASVARAQQVFTPDTPKEDEPKKLTVCDQVKFCNDFMTYVDQKLNSIYTGPISQYNMDGVAITSDNQLFARLQNPAPLKNNAGTIALFLTFYQDGIMKVNMQVDGEEPRFSISSTGIGVEWSQLTQVTNLVSHVKYLGTGVQLTFVSTDGLDTTVYFLQYKPFRILQYVNGVLTMIMNDHDTLQYASPDAPHDSYYVGGDQIITGYEIGLGFTLSSSYVYGIPQRNLDSFALPATTVNNPYRLFNTDQFDHPYGTADALYGSWPYLTAHSTDMDASVTWMNSSETYVSVSQTTNPVTQDPATMASFVSLGNKFEFFTFGSTNGPKRNQRLLSEVTGFPPIPPIHSLGYHYCKWEQNSADLMMTRNEEFTQYGFPVDVFWSDLYYTQEMEYFVFNRETWPLYKVQQLNEAIAEAKRRLVVINDPHIYVNEDYFVYARGMEI